MSASDSSRSPADAGTPTEALTDLRRLADHLRWDEVDDAEQTAIAERLEEIVARLRTSSPAPAPDGARRGLTDEEEAAFLDATRAATRLYAARLRASSPAPAPDGARSGLASTLSCGCGFVTHDFMTAVEHLQTCRSAVPPTPKLFAVREKGKLAYEGGWNLRDNPYEEADSRDAWIAGWVAAKLRAPVPPTGATSGEREADVHGVTFLFLHGGHVLLERCEKKARVLGVGEWFVPGGKLEAGETPREALDREVREEWGVGVVDAVPLPIVEGSPVPPGPRGLFLMRPFVVTLDGPPPWSHSLDGQTPLRWVPIDEALRSPVPQVRMMVAAAARSSPDATPAGEPHQTPRPYTVEEYAAAARSIMLNLAEFCDGSLLAPHQIADAARKARAEIERLRREVESQLARAERYKKAYNDLRIATTRTDNA